MSEDIIRLESVHKSFASSGRRLKVLSGLEAAIREGEFVAVKGRSGAGKTTLLNVIAGFLPPEGGTVRVRGQDLYALRDTPRSRFRNENIGFIFQQFFLIPYLSCVENISLPGLFSMRLRGKELSRRVDEIIEMMELQSMRDSYPATLSGGQQQRIAVGRALLMQPRILLCDEPIGDLDRESGGRILDIFKNLSRNNHITLIVVTHMDRVARLADRTLELVDGKVKDASPA
jgi:putative ABC transport system ATP-binding protein